MTTKVSLSGSIQAGAFAGIVSGIVNAALFYLFHGMDIIRDDVLIMPDQYMSVLPVVITSFVTSIVGAFVYYLLDKYTQRGYRIFTIIAIVILLVSFTNPFLMIDNVPLTYAMALNIMHVVVVGVLFYFIKRAK
ncbi:MAG: hypothetical protein IPI60_08845 [Saprospiraceae bacterium]|nr:hypothetical protein [Saprospiraceae bacterium]